MVLLEPHTSVVDVPEGRVDELPQGPGLLCDVHQQRDGDVLTPVEVQQGFRQTCFTRGWLWQRITPLKAPPLQKGHAYSYELQSWMGSVR